MSLPRFTSGSVGNLNFSHLNDAFGYIDLARNEQTDRPSRQNETLPLIVAKITQSDSDGNHKWKEVALSGNAYVDLENGRSSGDSFEFPARTMDGSTIPDGANVILVSKRKTDGSIYFLILGTEGGDTRMIRILAVNQVIRPLAMWSYWVAPVVFDAGAIGGPAWIGSTQTGQAVALNGCENPFDNNAQIGVGTIVPSGVTFARQPIRAGTVCLARIVSPSVYHFSIPNGYSYTCST